ncbi:MAG: aminoglycoside phosphotransferase family protein [Kiritimatiellae bacterium]|nr:aminoglycoside phosphotransferase family protein [Kiritimatiellia bacterium]
MSNRTYSREELVSVLAGFGIKDPTDVGRYGSGHINDTFKVETESGARYILQRVTDAFDKDVLKANIIRVTGHLKSKGVRTLEVVGYENPWRVYAFLEGYTSVDVISEPSQAELAAGAFAAFQNALSDLPEPALLPVIPRFHDTVDRIRLLDEAAAADVKGRRAQVAAELAFVDARREEAAKVVTMMAKGEIPERITHNDTKINNVMMAPDGSNVVIDLDTTMPGSALYDFGDMVRTSSAAAAEDERDLSKVYSKREYFEALVKGYLAQAKFLTEAERENLAFSGRLITLTIGIRFLTDYLAGDTYFRTAYGDHNLVRCRTQFKMVESMEAQAAEYEAIVRRYAK